MSKSRTLRNFETKSNPGLSTLLTDQSASLYVDLSYTIAALISP